MNHKKTGPKAGFLFLKPELLGSRSGSSFSSGLGRVDASSRSGFSGSGFSGSGFSGSSFSGSSFHRSSSFSSGRFSSGRFSRSSSFFFLTASGHGNGQQSSQEDGIFHLISLYLLYI